EGHCVGIITETDLFKVFLDLLGAREIGVRVTIRIEDKTGKLAKVTHEIAQADGSILTLGQLMDDDNAYRLVTFKVKNLDENKIREILTPIVFEIVDIRTC
ncbi:MAG TPA: hypothetical protein VN226_01840, partial [Anaerolineales bacterium]|nr:hypothetical protein [Anaerolineales bacterium]